MEEKELIGVDQVKEIWAQKPKEEMKFEEKITIQSDWAEIENKKSSRDFP